MSPVFIAAVLAYLLDPLVDFFQGRLRGKSRSVGAVLTYLLIALILSVLLFAGFLKLGIRGDLTQSTANAISKILNDFSDFFALLQIQFAEWNMSYIFAPMIVDAAGAVSEFTESIGKKIVPLAASAGNILLNFFIGLVLTFYLLKEKNRIVVKLNELMVLFLPDRVRRFMINIAGDIDMVVSGYIRGQLTDAFIMMVLISVWLSVVGVKHAVLIGIISGIANVVPYFGATVGVIISAMTAFLGGESAKAFTAALGVAALQQVDGMIITPKVVGKNVRMNPALILLSIIIGGRLFGVTGMILGVPVCAVGKMIINRLIERKSYQLAHNA